MIDVPKQNTPVMDADVPALMSKPWWIALKNWVLAFNTLAAEPLVLSVQSVQANLTLLSASLAAGTLVEVTDYAHVLRWTGSAYEWGPGESGSGYFAPFAVSPTGSGWHLCDGTAGVTYLKSDGTTGTVTLPNTAATPAYLKLGPAYSATITAATVPTISTPTFAGTPVTPAGTVSAIAAGSGVINVLASSVTSVTTAAHTHPAPTFTGSPLTPAGTVSTPTATLPGDPIAHFPAPIWFRQ